MVSCVQFGTREAEIKCTLLSHLIRYSLILNTLTHVRLSTGKPELGSFLVLGVSFEPKYLNPSVCKAIKYKSYQSFKKLDRRQWLTLNSIFSIINTNKTDLTFVWKHRTTICCKKCLSAALQIASEYLFVELRTCLTSYFHYCISSYLFVFSFSLTP